jgi:uncharacterized protein (UPF0218 family)
MPMPRDEGLELASLRAEVAALWGKLAEQQRQIESLQNDLVKVAKAIWPSSTEVIDTGTRPFKPESGCLESDIRPAMTGKFRHWASVVSIAGENDMLVTTYLSPHKLSTLWITGVPTRGLADDSTVTFNGDFLVIGTKQFIDPVSGVPKTVFLLRPQGRVTYQLAK